MIFNPYAIPPLLAGLLNLALAFWVHRQSPPGRVRQTFIFWNMSLAIWNIGVAGGYVISNATDALLWYRLFVLTGVRFIAPTFLHFAVAITETGDSPKNRWAIRLAYAVVLVFLVIGASTPFLIKDVKHYYWGYYPLAEPGEMLFGIPFVAIILYACRLLYNALKTAEHYQRNQLKYVLGGAAIVYGLGWTNFLPLYGIPFYPIGNLTNSAYSLLVAYAILEYGLMDISVILRRGTVYAMLSGGLTAVYLSLVAVLQRLFGHYGIQENYVFYTAAFPITVILAPTMKTRIEPWVDRTFFTQTETKPSLIQENKEIALMGILATQMAHELTKPLTHIMNEGARLERTLKGQAMDSLVKISKEVQRATEILDGFVLLSPDRPLHRLPVPFLDLIEEGLVSLNIENDRSIKVIRQFNDIPPILVNPGQLVQVFTNLIQNAWQAMPQGGTLTLSTRLFKQDARFVEVEVAITDTGPGIPHDLQSKIFEPFFTTKKARGGHGVGLTLCQAIVRRHGGQITIESPLTPMGGTRVIMHLPINPKEAPNET